MLTAFPLQKCLPDRGSMLRYTYNACLVISRYLKDGHLKNFAELRYNIAAGAVVFQCTLTLLPP
jgi:hypothetical protein